ncbi:MAG: DotA/TraY family protein [Alphaproteobacteria bacterium]|nr:DotA/TraY family protein [Alphaproteobacteria bacterium]
MTTQAKLLTGRNVARYILLPGILPRLKEFAGSGFGYFAFLIASVYASVRILPPQHPYANPANIGKFTLRQVVAAAANNITVSKKNIDQIVIFVAILAAIILLCFQFITLIFVIFGGSAFAQEAEAAKGTLSEIFVTTKPEKDIAFMLMDHVFGIKDFFKSSVATGTPFHVALQSLFEFYNYAILVVAVLVFLYYVVVVVAETAQTGVPFGKRFSHIYAPLRLVFAIGLLVPINYGFNTAQYIVLYAAKLGSSMATNGWIVFNKALNNQNPLGAEPKTLIADAKAPDITSLISFMTVAHACREAHMIEEGIKIEPYISTRDLVWAITDTSNSVGYDTALTLTEGGNITIVFGKFTAGDAMDKDSKSKGVEFCGSLRLPVNSGVFKTREEKDSKKSAGERAVGKAYYDLINRIWADEKVKALGERFAHALYYLNANDGGATIMGDPCHGSDQLGDSETCKSRYKPPAITGSIKEIFQPEFDRQIKEAIKTARDNADFAFEENIAERGWGGAGIWYNKIAEANGSFLGTIFDVPAASKFPQIMEDVREEKKKHDKGASNMCKLFEPTFSNNKPVFDSMADNRRSYYARVTSEAFGYWNCEAPTEDKKGLTGNIVWDTMNMIFGTKGLFDMVNNKPDAKGNLPVHPLAQMVAIGKGMLDSSVRNLGYSMGFAVGGGILGALNKHLGESLQAVSGFFLGIATVGLSVGFVLFYILPFLPFIYFFFAVGSWVKTIFEAMVGAPLWALAHLRIDGDGFSGKSANGGYFLILEILIRPILTVFGLIGGMAIFTAMVSVLNELFKLVVLNTTGTELTVMGTPAGGTPSPAGDSGIDVLRRSIVDQFFFTIVYTVISYMLATTSFKMIDLVPKAIMRWMGSGVSSFGDNIQDATGELTKYATIGSTILGGQVTGAMNKLGSAAGATGGALIKAGADSGGAAAAPKA